MFISFVILALSASFYCASAVEKQLNEDSKEELGLLKKELENLKQRLGKVDALENEVKQLKWQLVQQKTERSEFLSFFLTLRFNKTADVHVFSLV